MAFDEYFHFGRFRIFTFDFKDLLTIELLPTSFFNGICISGGSFTLQTLSFTRRRLRNKVDRDSNLAVVETAGSKQAASVLKSPW